PRRRGGGEGAARPIVGARDREGDGPRAAAAIHARQLPRLARGGRQAHDREATAHVGDAEVGDRVGVAVVARLARALAVAAPGGRDAAGDRIEATHAPDAGVAGARVVVVTRDRGAGAQPAPARVPRGARVAV